MSMRLKWCFVRWKTSGTAQASEKDCEISFVTTADPIGRRGIQTEAWEFPSCKKAVYDVAGHKNIDKVRMHLQ